MIYENEPSLEKKKLYYPIPVSGLNGFIFSLVFGSFITFFLWFFEPFDINIQGYSIFEILFFGFISFSVFFLAHTILPLILPNIYKEQKWTIYSQILFYVILSFAIATLNGLFINYRNSLSFDWSNYLLIITQTFAVGIIPITLSVLFSYFWKYKKIVEQSSSYNEKLSHLKESEPHQYTIHSNIKNETFLIDDHTFLFAKSSGNYIEIFVSDQPPKLYRMSISNLEEQLTASDAMIRCHRSYFVNTKQIVKVTGNAQGLKLWPKDEQIYVPVSRKYLSKAKSVFTNL